MYLGAACPMSPASAPSLESLLYHRAAVARAARLWRHVRLRRCSGYYPTGENPTLLEVLLSIVESAGNERALTAPVIWAVSDLLLAHPSWFGSDWLDALDAIDLAAVYETAKANRKAVQPRAAIAAILFERLKDRLPVTRRALYRRSKDRASASASTAPR